MNKSSTKQLGDDQLKNFDWEFIGESKRRVIWDCINRDFPSGEFSFIDIGGGNGSFTDHVLDQYPNSQGVVLDNSSLLIKKNKDHPRKRVFNTPAEELEKVLDEKFDVVFLNFILHHLVGDSYALTRKNQLDLLKTSKNLLTENGRLSIYENMYDGALVHFLPSHLIFHITSSKTIGNLTRRLGANTGGVGVCFLSKKQWHSVLKESNIKTTQYTDDKHFIIPLYQKIILHLGDIRNGHFWCHPE